MHAARSRAVDDGTSALASIPLFVELSRTSGHWCGQVVAVVTLGGRERVRQRLAIGASWVVGLLGLLLGKVTRWVVPVGLGRGTKGGLSS